MPTMEHTRLLAGLAEAYARHAPMSRSLNERAAKVLVDGGSHTLRLIQPFPLRFVAARGAWVTWTWAHVGRTLRPARPVSEYAPWLASVPPGASTIRKTAAIVAQVAGMCNRPRL